MLVITIITIEVVVVASVSAVVTAQVVAVAKGSQLSSSDDTNAIFIAVSAAYWWHPKAAHATTMATARGTIIATYAQQQAAAALVLAFALPLKLELTMLSARLRCCCFC